MNSKPGWACALSIFIFAGTARAQATPPPWIPPQYLAHISIHAAPATELEVAPAKASSSSPEPPAVVRCTEYCDFWAPPGKYTLYTRDHSGQRKDLGLRIKQSSRFELEPGDDEARTTGLVVGSVGAAALLTGFILITPMILSAMCEGDCTTSGERDAATVGLGLLIGGAIATPVGFGMFASNRTRLKRIDDEPYFRASEPKGQVRVGVVGVGPGALGLGVAATF